MTGIGFQRFVCCKMFR